MSLMDLVMGLTPSLGTDPAHLADVAELLTLCGLPTAGLDDASECLALRRDGRVIASAALEIHGKSGLLRSVAIHPDLQRQRLGTALVTTAIVTAGTYRIRHLYLLTESAADFFARFKFTVIDRADVDPAIQQTVEFTSACPASATVMLLDLTRFAAKP
ncbi:MAG: GNAT family N-acetyltransferase [Caldilineaceae bacterium]|nr:GNAT family N-acetyltransferase [Caldilineaceae bacterium]MBP8107635.1 GNAT family N-acetyltransferase [Caldilineaceae bacterium]MBP8123256.1 GNAT family N-acetyltransferase [Caldilineaceae bacterium]MBP9072745.1 GNAT family N-acetyltransferase [Caldilineaceae bacterium]